MAFSLSSLSKQLRLVINRYSGLKKSKIEVMEGRDELFDVVWNFSQNIISTRNYNFKVYEDFFNGNDAQKAYFKKFADEEDADYERRVDRSVAVNKSRPIALKGPQSMFGLSRPVRRMEDDRANERMSDVWKYNKVESGFFHYKLAVELSKFGYCIVRNEFVEKKTRQPITYRSGRKEDYEVIYKIQEPYLTIPVGRPNNSDELGAVIILHTETQERTMSIPIDSDSMPNIVAIEYVDDNVWRKWRILDFNKEGKAKAVSVDMNFGNMVNVNPYGRVDIPFTIYINPGSDSFNLNGHSDIEDVVGINLKYNEVVSDDAHVISNNTWPIALFTGMDIPKTYKRGASDVLSTKNSDADGKILTWDSDLEAIGNLETRLSKDMLTVSGYSAVMFGDLENIGQIRNLKGAMVPDLLTISTKQLFFKEAEQSHATATLDMIEWHELDEYPNKDIDITISNDYIPQDELTVAEATTIRAKLGLEDVRKIIMREHPELETSDQVDDYIKKNIELLKELGVITEKDVTNVTEDLKSKNPDRKEREQARTDDDEQ